MKAANVLFFFFIFLFGCSYDPDIASTIRINRYVEPNDTVYFLTVSFINKTNENFYFFDFSEYKYLEIYDRDGDNISSNLLESNLWTEHFGEQYLLKNSEYRSKWHNTNSVEKRKGDSLKLQEFIRLAIKSDMSRNLAANSQTKMDSNRINALKNVLEHKYYFSSLIEPFDSISINIDITLLLQARQIFKGPFKCKIKYLNETLPHSVKGFLHVYTNESIGPVDSVYIKGFPNGLDKIGKYKKYQHEIKSKTVNFSVH